jgi:hypothetical protein
MRSVGSAALGALALTLSTAALAASGSLPARITLDGVAGVVPGQSPEEVERRWGVPVQLPDNIHSLGCERAYVDAGSMRGYALFENGRLGAVFFDRGAVTDKGIRIGSTVGQLRRAYGSRLTSRTKRYPAGARDYFVRRARTPHWELRFDVSPAGRVTQIGFGAAPVRYTNGCSE